MKKTTKIRLFCGLFVTAAGFLGTASAHDVTGTLTTGTFGTLSGVPTSATCATPSTFGCGPGAGATDIWSITCTLDPNLSQNPTDRLSVQIQDRSTAGGPITATATSDVWAVTVTDTSVFNPGTTTLNAASPAKIVKASTPNNNATFAVVVHHTAAAADNYLLSVHCQDAAGDHTGTNVPTLIQDE